MNDHIPSGLGAGDRVDSGAGAESVHQVSAVPSEASKAHTPGPWTAEVEADGDHLFVTGAGGASVIGGCGCCGSPFMDKVHAQADARLIAAAPDLLEALRTIVTASDSDAASGGEMFWAEVVYPVVDRARAAIAAATGGKTA